MVGEAHSPDPVEVIATDIMVNRYVVIALSLGRRSLLL